MLLDYLKHLRGDFVDFNSAIFTIKQRLFLNTSASADAQQKLESSAFANRETLLQ
jgi:hypothetical protein